MGLSIAQKIIREHLVDGAAKYGILLSKPGNGICHQVHLERFGLQPPPLLRETKKPPPLRRGVSSEARRGA